MTYIYDDFGRKLRETDALGRFWDPRQLGRRRARPRPQSGSGIAYLWTAVLGRPGRALAAALGARPQSIYAAATRGRASRAQWDRLVEKLR